MQKELFYDTFGTIYFCLGNKTWLANDKVPMFLPLIIC